MKHLLKLIDLSTEEITEILNLSDQLKYELKNNIPHPRLAGKTLGMIFQKSSTRTRVSFEVGMYQLGGHPLFLSANDLQIGRGEPTADTARVMSRYCDGIMIRTFEQAEVEEFAKYSTIPVINALTDFAHPCQIFADLLTIREYKGSFEGLKVCFIGDTNNMANSFIVGALKVGMKFTLASPAGYVLHPEIAAFVKDNPNFEQTTDVLAAAKEADVVVTDVWASMGDEAEAQKRQQDFVGYQINNEVMANAKSDAIVLHCLPAHREEEITTEVFEKYANVIFDEAENRLHVQKAILVKLMEK
ncbi:MAG: ornithine carbamoyltransferase [Enterococcus sp.]|nr:ornithine carbamoyltransferase [Enterococcus sp.]MBP7085497.1 ornithine carbamoyltransferase [Enterococcus sp.]MBP8693000.1 ornithine carbamoyltransferase [Enterococcus sp.]MBP9521115.1 ornithine carbamoyltransferase [Enterococcus sp.]MBP9639363.1 ornithine carbamoyltransferase [Enterococcus sp.]